MGTFFNPEIGWQKKDLETIQKEKARELEKSLGKAIDSSSGSIWQIINQPSSLLDEKINQSLGELLQRFSEFVSDTQNQVKIPASSTSETIVLRFFEFVPSLEYISLDQNIGKISLYLFFKEDANHKTYEKDIWQAIHTLKPAGIVTQGEIQVSNYSTNRQWITYNYSLGVRKYVYLRVEYATQTKDFLVENADSHIKKLYQEVITKKYHKASVDLFYQDFVTPTLEIQGISHINFYYSISEDKTLDINDIAKEKFTLNQNRTGFIDEVLLFSLTTRLLIERIN